MKEKKFFLEKSCALRSIIFLLFASLLFLFFHYRKSYIDIPEVNSIAKRYIAVEVEFSFFDELATKIRKQEALKEVGKIWQIYHGSIEESSKEIERQLFSHEESSEEERRDRLLLLMREFFSWAKNVRYVDETTLQKIEQTDLFSSGNSLHSSFETLHFFPSMHTGKDPLIFPEQVIEEWLHLPFSSSEENFLGIISEVLKNSTWSLKEDIHHEGILQSLIEESVPQVFMHYRLGERLVEKGEKISTRHVAILRSMQKALNEQKSFRDHFLFFGSLLLSLLFTLLAKAYLYSYQSKVFFSNRRLTLLLLIFFLSFSYVKLIEYFFFHLPNELRFIFHLPILFPFASMLLYPLFEKQIAFIVTGFLGLLFLFSSPFGNEKFVLVNCFAGVTTLLGMKKCKQRKELFSVICTQWFYCSLLLLALRFINHTFYWEEWLKDCTSAFAFLFMTGILVIGILPLLESLFSILTDNVIMEYLDPSHTLLRRLSVEAPGTYHHSLIVALLSESAAMKIGANALFCRAASMYHDIGKLHNPYYYWENQHGNVSMHQLLKPEESSQVIIKHVSEGVSLARKEHLPKEFIDIIREHHGTTLAYYFYYKFCEETRKREKPISDEDSKKNFRYPGPIPQTRESVIVMIADSLEASSRALGYTDRESLENLAHNIVQDKQKDGQFKESPITLQELEMIQQEMVTTLINSHHSRIKYPEKKVS